MTLSRFAPMIDLSFLLLVFFMTTTRFDRPEGLLASALPAVSGASGPALPFSPLVIRLKHEGPDSAEYRLVVDGFDDVPGTTAGLPEFLGGVQQLPGFDRHTPVVIVADNAVAWDHVVGCWNGVLRAGYKRIAFAEP